MGLEDNFMPKPVTQLSQTGISLVTVSEFAKRIGVSPWTIRTWIEEGRLSSTKLGRGHRAPVRIPSTEFDRVLLENFRPATRPFRLAHKKV
jgi:excisionase family DNA binding protein